MCFSDLLTYTFLLLRDLIGLDSSSWKNLLYLDVDVWVSNPISEFIADLPPLSSSDTIVAHNSNSITSHTNGMTIPWVTLFADCAGHAIGWCSGCNAWNTGVMIYSRSDRTDHCLNEWKQMLLRGDYSTDQEALEHVARCCLYKVPYDVTFDVFNQSLHFYLSQRWNVLGNICNSSSNETSSLLEGLSRPSLHSVQV